MNSNKCGAKVQIGSRGLVLSPTVGSCEQSKYSRANQILEVFVSNYLLFSVGHTNLFLRYKQMYLVLTATSLLFVIIFIIIVNCAIYYEGWNFNSGNYLFTTDTK